MTAIFKKLKLKEQMEILVLNAPESFQSEMDGLALTGVKIFTGDGTVQEVAFVLGFVKTREEVEQVSQIIAKKVTGDVVVWFAYPKGTSKKYTCDFNRDTGWHVMGNLGFEKVSQVAIDEDWSALRFRRVEFIKLLSRSETFALSKEGKEKAANKGTARVAFHLALILLVLVMAMVLQGCAPVNRAHGNQDALLIAQLTGQADKWDKDIIRKDLPAIAA